MVNTGYNDGGKGNELRIPKAYIWVKKDYGGVTILEDLGDTSLEKIFLSGVDEDEKNQLIKKSIDALISFHILCSEDGQAFRYVRKKEDHSKEFIDNIGCMLKLEDPDKFKDWLSDGSEEMKGYFSGIKSVLDDESKYIIHQDFHPGNLLKKGDDINIVDFDHVGLGPHQFDLVDFLKHPSLNLSRDVVEGWCDYYLFKKFDHYAREEWGQKKLMGRIFGLIRRFSNVDKDYKKEFLKVFYLSNLVRDIRGVGFPSLLKLSEPDMYEDRVRRRPEYKWYKDWYLNDYKLVLDLLLKEYERFGLSDLEVSSIEGIKDISEEYGLLRNFEYSKVGQGNYPEKKLGENKIFNICGIMERIVSLL